MDREATVSKVESAAVSVERFDKDTQEEDNAGCLELDVDTA